MDNTFFLLSPLVSNKTFFAQSAGGRSQQKVWFVFDNKKIQGTCANDLSAGECLAVQTDSGEWWLFSLSVQQGKISQIKSIELRRTQHKIEIDFPIVTLFRIDKDLYIGGNQPAKKILSITQSGTIEGYAVNGRSANFYTRLNLTSTYWHYLNSSTKFLSNSGSEYYLGDGVWEACDNVSDRVTVVKDEKQYNTLSTSETILYDRDGNALTLTQVDAYTDIWTPESPTRLDFTRRLKNIVYDDFEPPASGTNWFKVDTQGGARCRASFGFWRRIEQNVYSGEQGGGEKPSSGAIDEGGDGNFVCGEYTLSEYFGNIHLQYPGISVVEIQNEIERGGYARLCTDEHTGYNNYYYDIAYNALDARNEYVHFDLPPIVTGFYDGEGNDDGPSADLTAPWQLLGSYCSPSIPDDPEDPVDSPSYNEEYYTERCYGSFVCSAFLNGYILQAVDFQKQISIKLGERKETLEEKVNTLVLKSKTGNAFESIILNNSDFLVISSWATLSSIGFSSTSFSISINYEVKDFNPSNLIGMPILFNTEIEGIFSLISGAIASASYQQNTLFLNISISTIKKNVVTSFKGKLISNNGSCYSYHLRNFTATPFVTKFVLKAVPLSAIVSVFMKTPFSSALGELTGKNFQSDSIVKKTIYSVVAIKGSSAKVDKWRISNDGRVSYLGVASMKYYPLSKKDPVILSHSTYV